MLSYNIEFMAREYWTHEDFKSYLLGLIDFRLQPHPAEEDIFPPQITPNRNFHDILSFLRERTRQDGKARVKIVGVSRARDVVQFSPAFLEPVEGALEENQELVRRTMDELTHTQGFDAILGFAVTRPRDLTGRWGEERNDFSSDRLMTLLLGDLIGLPYQTQLLLNVGPTGNTLALRSDNSTSIDDPYALHSALEEITPISYDQRTEALAKAHHLVIYRGYANRELNRLFPKPDPRVRRY